MLDSSGDPIDWQTCIAAKVRPSEPAYYHPECGILHSANAKKVVSTPAVSPPAVRKVKKRRNVPDGQMGLF